MRRIVLEPVAGTGTAPIAGTIPRPISAPIVAVLQVVDFVLIL
jgi:hypothetical protein